MVRKENIPLLTGFVSLLAFYALFNVPTQINSISMESESHWVFSYILFFLSYGLSLLGSFVGIRLLFKEDYRLKVILGAVLSVCIMGLATLFIIVIYGISNYGV